MPIRQDAPFALSAPDRDFETMHRNQEFHSLDPLYRHAHRIIMAQLVQLRTIFALDRGDSQPLAFATGLRIFHSP